jgi:DNA-3-methyladenine glycosylase II
MLNLKEDLSKFYALARRDPLIKILVSDLYGMRNTKQTELFPRLILAVTLQMAPISRSDQMMSFLIKEYGEEAKFDDREIQYWPSPARIANASVEELREKCKLGYRAGSLKSIAETICKRFPGPQELESMPPQEAKTKLMELKGIGEYSADIVLPQIGLPLDVWSAKIFNHLLLRKLPQSPRKAIPRLKKIAEERWGIWKGYVFIYVLHDLPNLSRKLKVDLTQL